LLENPLPKSVPVIGDLTVPDGLHLPQSPFPFPREGLCGVQHLLDFGTVRGLIFGGCVGQRFDRHFSVGHCSRCESNNISEWLDQQILSIDGHSGVN